MSMIKSILIVGAGSFLGGAARYAVSLMMKNQGKGFPWATLTANLIGCLLIGILWGSFSTFCKESLMMLQAVNLWSFAAYVALSIIAGTSLVALGSWLVRG